MENKSENPILLKVAEAVSDGKPIDWEVEGKAPESDAQDLSSLRVLEKVATGYRAAADLHAPFAPDARGSNERQDSGETAANPSTVERRWAYLPRGIVGWLILAAGLAAVLIVLGRWLGP